MVGSVGTIGTREVTDKFRGERGLESVGSCRSPGRSWLLLREGWGPLGILGRYIESSGLQMVQMVLSSVLGADGGFQPLDWWKEI